MKKCILVLSCILGASLFAVSFAGYGEGTLSAAESDMQEQEMSKEEVEEMLGDGTDSDEAADTDTDGTEDETGDTEEADDDAQAIEIANSTEDDLILQSAEQNLQTLLGIDLTQYDPEAEANSADAPYINSWYEVHKEAGEYISTDESSVVRDGRKLSGVFVTTCENAKVEFTVTFDAIDGLESITAVNLTKQEEENTTLAQSMMNAGVNTLLGMGTVFVMLIIIAYIISLFKYIPKLVESFRKKPEAVSAPAAAPVAVPEPVTVQEEISADDGELAAVIAAAIAAYEGDNNNVGGFVVRSIRKHK